MAQRAAREYGYDRLLADIQRFPPLTREIEMEHALKAAAGDRAATDTLVCANLRYVVKLANQYRGYGLRPADLVEEGILGLLEAARRFDPSRNLRFWTYAAWWVRAYMLAFVLKQWSIVGTGTGPLQSKMFFRLARERARVQAETGQTGVAADGELAETFGTSEERVREMSDRLGNRDSSLDAPAFREGEGAIVDQLVDEGNDVHELAVSTERDRRVREHLARLWPSLDERERVIVELRLLPGEDGATLAELGDRFGLSRERVRQLEERVKGKLRRALGKLAAA